VGAILEFANALERAINSGAPRDLLDKRIAATEYVPRSVDHETNQVKLIENMLHNLARINPDGDSRIDAKQRATIKTAKQRCNHGSTQCPPQISSRAHSPYMHSAKATRVPPSA